MVAQINFGLLDLFILHCCASIEVLRVGQSMGSLLPSALQAGK